MAIEHFNSYPHFVANQVLRSSDLNNSFAFLDVQAKLSRFYLCGQGVVNGLEISYLDGVLKIGKGIALNDGGWIVRLPEDAEYRYAAPVPSLETDFVSDSLEDLAAKGGSHVDYICFKTQDDAREMGLEPIPLRDAKVNVTGHAVALAFGKRRELSNRCSHDSCDINVSKMLVEAWPVLVNKEKPLYWNLPLFEETVSSSFPPALISCGDIKVFNQRVKCVFNELSNEVCRKMLLIFEDLLLQTIAINGVRGFSASASPWDNVFPECRRLIGRFQGGLTKISGYFKSGNEDFIPDYFLSFFGNLRQAIREFIETYNEFAGEFVRIPDSIPADYLTYLGKPSSDGSYDDQYRSHFRKVDNEREAAACRKLERMLRRICVLSEHFIGARSAEELKENNLHSYCCRPYARLSETPIPFYYNKAGTKEFLDCWNADKASLYRRADDYYQPARIIGTIVAHEMPDTTSGDGQDIVPGRRPLADDQTIHVDLTTGDGRITRLELATGEERITHIDLTTADERFARVEVLSSDERIKRTDRLTLKPALRDTDSMKTDLSGTDFHIDSYMGKSFSAVQEVLALYAENFRIDLTVREVPLRAIGRLSAEQKDYLLEYFDADAFTSTYTDPIRQSGSNNAKSIAAILIGLYNFFVKKWSGAWRPVASADGSQWAGLQTAVVGNLIQQQSDKLSAILEQQSVKLTEVIEKQTGRLDLISEKIPVLLEYVEHSVKEIPDALDKVKESVPEKTVELKTLSAGIGQDGLPLQVPVDSVKPSLGVGDITPGKFLPDPIEPLQPDPGKTPQLPDPKLPPDKDPKLPPDKDPKFPPDRDPYLPFEPNPGDPSLTLPSDSESSEFRILLSPYPARTKDMKSLSDLIVCLSEGTAGAYGPICAWAGDQITDKMMEDLWDMTQLFKEGSQGMKPKDSVTNRFSDLAYSSFLALINCLRNCSCGGAKLEKAILKGAILPGSTVYLFTNDGKVVSYAVSR